MTTTTTHPPFVPKLFDIVSDPNTDQLCSWSTDGTQLTIHQSAEFAREVLPKYFKHSNFSSFVRQLNQYGFSKIDQDTWTFGHHFFLRDRKDMLSQIKRKHSSANHSKCDHITSSSSSVFSSSSKFKDLIRVEESTLLQKATVIEQSNQPSTQSLPLVSSSKAIVPISKRKVDSHRNPELLPQINIKECYFVNNELKTNTENHADYERQHSNAIKIKSSKTKKIRKVLPLPQATVSKQIFRKVLDSERDKIKTCRSVISPKTQMDNEKDINIKLASCPMVSSLITHEEKPALSHNPMANLKILALPDVPYDDEKQVSDCTPRNDALLTALLLQIDEKRASMHEDSEQLLWESDIGKRVATNQERIEALEVKMDAMQDLMHRCFTAFWNDNYMN